MVKRKFFSLMGSKSLGGPEWAQAGLVPREETKPCPPMPESDVAATCAKLCRPTSGKHRIQRN